jgi:vacuolar-type H+-ATPase subunit I/STV1
MEGMQREGDWKGFFSVQEKLVKVLQSLGIVDQAIHRVEVTHKMEDNTKAEIEAMLALERKQQKRLDEIARSQGITLDAVPKLEFENEK